MDHYDQNLPLTCELLQAGWIAGADAWGQVGVGGGGGTIKDAPPASNLMRNCSGVHGGWNG
jgi:hypothetical protein